jgi:hypothetical protein
LLGERRRSGNYRRDGDTRPYAFLPARHRLTSRFSYSGRSTRSFTWAA